MWGFFEREQSKEHRIMAVSRITCIQRLLNPKNVIIVFLITIIIFLVKKVDIADITLRKVFTDIEMSTLNHVEEKEIKPTCPPLKLVNSDKEFLDYFNNIEGECSSWKTFGSPKQGGLKYVCLDPKFNIKPGNCTVLSFGINNEWSFDDDMDKFNCKVYSFDPTMGKEDHQRSPNIKFFKLGIGNLDGQAKVGFGDKAVYGKNYKSLPVDRYENILKRIGLLNTQIDYLKMDVDFAELNFLMDVFVNSPHLLKNIKQIGMEVHHYLSGKGLGYDSLFQLFWVAFQKLRCAGFKLYWASKPSQWHEVVWALEGDWK